MSRMINTDRRLTGGARLFSQEYLLSTAQGRSIDGLMSAATIATATAVTLTAAQILGGLILQDPAGGAVTTNMPTAALLAEYLGRPKAGTAFEFTIRNTADQAETITVEAGSGGTFSGTKTIAQNNTKRFLVVLTNTIRGSEAYTVYSLGTVVH